MDENTVQNQAGQSTDNTVQEQAQETTQPQEQAPQPAEQVREEKVAQPQQPAEQPKERVEQATPTRGADGLTELERKILEHERKLRLLEKREEFERFLMSEEGSKFAQYKDEIQKLVTEAVAKGDDILERLSPKEFVLAKLGDKILAELDSMANQTPAEGTAPMLSEKDVDSMERDEIIELINQLADE